MAAKKVIKIGNPLLAKKSRPIENVDEFLRAGLIQDMLDTMKAENGAGLAAPQIGESVRVVIFGINKNPRYPDVEPVPTTVLINPVITPLNNEIVSGWEGCLSVPGFRGVVPRYKHIRYQGLDEHGNIIDREVSDFHARVVQHEVDHLDGVLYVQRIEDMRNFGLIPELEEAGIIPKVKE